MNRSTFRCRSATAVWFALSCGVASVRFPERTRSQPHRRGNRRPAQSVKPNKSDTTRQARSPDDGERWPRGVALMSPNLTDQCHHGPAAPSLGLQRERRARGSWSVLRVVDRERWERGEPHVDDAGISWNPQLRNCNPLAVCRSLIVGEQFNGDNEACLPHSQEP